MKEILGRESNLEGLKQRIPIGQERKIEASDWLRADDFTNQAIGLSSRNPCHSNNFGMIQTFLESLSHSHHSRLIHIIFKSFPFIFVSFYRHTPVLSDRRGKQLISYAVIHVILRSFISFQTHSYHLTVIHIIPDSFISFQSH